MDFYLFLLILPAYRLLSSDSWAKCMVSLEKAARDSFGAHLLCQRQTSSPHLLVLFIFQSWVHNRHARYNIGAVALLPALCLRESFLWLGDTVSCVICKIIWWHNSFWYCPYSSCHSVQMWFQIRSFPSGLFYPRITCDYMWNVAETQRCGPDEERSPWTHSIHQWVVTERHISF